MFCRKVMPVCAALSVCIPILNAQTPGRVVTIDQLVQVAMTQNRNFTALKQRVTEAQGLLRQAAVRPAPALELTGFTGKTLATVGEEEISVVFLQPIETFGKRGKRIRVAEKSVDLAASEIAERTRHLVAEVKTRFAEALVEQQKLEALERLLSLNRDSLRLIETRHRHGDAATLEVELMGAEVSRIEAQQALQAGRASSAMLDLKRAAGLDGAEFIGLASPQAARRIPPLAELQRRAREERADLQAARLSEERGEADVSLAQAEGRPDVTFSASYSRRNSRLDAQMGIPSLRDRDNILSFGVSVPLFSPKRNQGNVEAARARVSAGRLNREHLEKTIPLEVEAAYRRWTAAKLATEILDEGLLERFRRNLVVVRQAFELGQLRMLDVINEQRRLLETEITHIEARGEGIKALAELERAVGGFIQ